MKKLQKKEIRATVESAMTQALSTLQIQEPSKKTKKVLHKVSKTVLSEVKRVLDKRSKKENRAPKAAVKNGKTSKKAQQSSQSVEA
jgi:DNA-binding protein Fis